MAVSMFALATLGQIKNELNLTTVNAGRDTWIERAIEAATDDIEAVCRRRFVARDYEETIDGTGTSTLFLPNYPILSVATLAQDSERTFSRSTDFVDRDSYIIAEQPDGVLRVFNKWGVFHKARQNVKVHYHAGYAFMDVPLGSQQLSFSEVSGGTRYTVEIPYGEYNAVSLGCTVANRMSLAGLNTYQVNYLTRERKYKIAFSTGAYQTLQIHASTGTANLLPIMGFATSADLTGATAYKAANAVSPYIPRAVSDAAVRLIVWRYDQSAYGVGGRSGIKSETIGDYSITFTDTGAEMPTHIFRSINRFRQELMA